MGFINFCNIHCSHDIMELKFYIRPTFYSQQAKSIFREHEKWNFVKRKYHLTTISQVLPLLSHSPLVPSPFDHYLSISLASIVPIISWDLPISIILTFCNQQAKLVFIEHAKWNFVKRKYHLTTISQVLPLVSHSPPVPFPFDHHLSNSITSIVLMISLALSSSTQFTFCNQQAESIFREHAKWNFVKIKYHLTSIS